ncbi:MAG: flagellar assembly protein FliW [Acidobacteriota bacterium]|nr:flagellar assembly protein FliW [Acidobacteriota bacterium]
MTPAASQTPMAGASVICSPWLGKIEVDQESALFFSAGIPGFEDLRSMIPVEIPAHRPIVYLQSVESSEICFVSLPVYVVDPGFRLRLSDEERVLLQLPELADPVLGEDVLCLALLRRSGPAAGANPVWANLAAAIVINLHNRLAVQCVPPAGASPCFRQLGEAGWTAAC